MPITGIDAAAKASREIVHQVHLRLSSANCEWIEDEDLSDSVVVLDTDVLHNDALPSIFALGGRSGANVVAHVAVLNKAHLRGVSESGLAIVHSASTQEAYDLSVIAHAFAAHGLGPVLHAVDSARTSFAFVAPAAFLGDAKEWVDQRNHLHNHDDHTTDAKHRIADEMEIIFSDFSTKTKRVYKPFEYFGSPEAHRVVVSTGATARTCMEWVKRYGADQKVGVVNVRVSRPWSASHFLRVLPDSVAEICATEEVFADAAASFHHEAAQSREEEPPLFVHGHTKTVTSLEHASELLGVHSDVSLHPWLREKMSSTLVKEIVCVSSSSASRGPLLAEVLGAHLGLKVQEYDAKHDKSGLIRKELRFSPIDISYLQYPIERADVVCLDSVSQCETMVASHLGKNSIVIINSSGLDLNRELSSSVKQALQASDAHLFSLDADALVRKTQGAPELCLPFIMLASALHFCSDVASYTQVYVHLAKKIQATFNHDEASRILCRELTDSSLSAGTWLKRVQIAAGHGSPARVIAVQEEECAFRPLELVSPLRKAPQRSLEDTTYHKLLGQLFRDRYVVSDSKHNLETAFGHFLSWTAAEKHAKSRWIVCSASKLSDIQGVHHVLASEEAVNVLLLCSESNTSRDVGLYAMNYGTAYVASICAEASHAQAVKALTEAEARKHKGPSVILAYLGPKSDVDTGSWPLYRWNPALQEDGSGSDPFTLDSAKLKSDLHEFLKRDQHLSLIARRSPVVNPTLTRSAESELDKKGQTAQARANEKKLASSFAALRGGLNQQNSSTVNLNLLVLYGSDGGNGASVAETLARKAELSGCGETRCQEANEFKLEDLENETHVIFVLATAGQGEDCANAKRLTADILASKTKLPKLKFAVFGLGDSAYWGEGSSDSAKYFCLPARRLHEKLKELSATPLVHVGLGDDQNDDGYDGALAEWEPALWKAMKVKVVSGNLGGAPPVVDDEIKIQSNYLRGTIAEGLADLSTGKLVFEDTKLTKFHGIYQQDDRDLREKLDAQGVERAYSFMIRIGVPGGVATAKQYLQMEELCDKYASGRLKVTTRQAYQFHGIIKKNLKTTMQGINRACMDTLAACGDVNRNIIANPRRHDGEVYEAVTQLARAIDAHLKPKTMAYHEIWLDKKSVAGFKDHEPLYGATYLPRKFKIAIAVPPENDVDVFAHCAGFIAIVQNGRLVGYNVCAGGGLGTTHGDKNTYPRLSDVLGFCLPEQAVKVVEGIMIVQRDHGERLNRKHARCKYTVEDHGYQWYRERVEEYCGFKLQEARPFKFETNADNYGWRRGTRTGLWTYTMFVESGYIHDENPQYKLKSALHEIAQLLTTFDGEVNLTANQNVILGAIPDSQKPNVMRLLAKWGVDNERYSAMRLHSMACVALPTCALAMAESQRYLPSLITKLEQTLDEVGLRHDAITIRMTGCPNGCARPYMAEIAFIGKAPGVYNLHLGGGFAGNRLNRIYREGVNEEQILGILRPLLIRYANERRPDERFGDFLIRVKVIMPVYHGHSFWAKDESENDTSSRSGTVQLYW